MPLIKLIINSLFQIDLGQTKSLFKFLNTKKLKQNHTWSLPLLQTGGQKKNAKKVLKSTPNIFHKEDIKKQVKNSEIFKTFFCELKMNKK